MILNIARCPHCGGTDFAVQVTAWVNIDAADDHSDEYPHFDSSAAWFDQEDAASAEPIEGGEVVCRNTECGAVSTNTAAGGTP